MEDRPDLVAYPEAVAAWATAEAQAALFRRHLAEIGPLADDGEPRGGVLGWLDKTENAAARHRATLGLDPQSEARLLRDRAAASVLTVDLEAIAATGRAALDRQAAAGLPGPPDLAGEVLAEVTRDGTAAWESATAEAAAEPIATRPGNGGGGTSDDGTK